MTDARRRVPSVDSLLRSDPGRRASRALGRPLLKRELAQVLGAARTAAEGGVEPPPTEELLAGAAERASRELRDQVAKISGERLRMANPNLAGHESGKALVPVADSVGNSRAG